MDYQRKNKSFFFNWWSTVDHLTLVVLGILIIFSAVMVATASPAIADRIGLNSYYFIKRQIIYLALAIIIMFSISCLSIENLKKLAFLGLLACIITLVIVLFKGNEVKGAKRWIYIAGFSLQPSEFAKPLFAVVTGYILSKRYSDPEFPAFKVATILYIILISLLILQPDFGMSVTVSAVWGAQLFLAGLSIVLIAAVIVISVIGFVGAYSFLPHVAKRINSFLDPDKGENYQIKKSLEAFLNGGLYGKGPGEGTVKQFLPDSHTDFIFAVVGEELGLIACLAIVAMFTFIVMRGFFRIMHETDLFVAFSGAGLLMQFGMQAIINMGVALHLLPTKGMTLPFLSYGGCSMFAISLAMGMILSMTRKRYGMVKIGGKGYRLWIK
jgi:cell division protein FtsW